MRRKRNLFIGSSLLALIIACGVEQPAVDEAADEQATGGKMAPMFEVDPLWPKNLPNHWLMGATIGVDVDSQDHIWIVHRNTPDQFAARTEVGLVQDPPLSECCAPGPPVLEFDQEGNLVGHWGGPGTETGDYVWPESNHGITIDHMDNVWIGGNGRADSHVLKFARDGTFLMSVGKYGARLVGEELVRDSHDMESFGRVAKIGIDAEANEAYFADGYFNKRVAVVDMDSGEIKRYWGAYGNEPDDELDLGRYSPDSEPASQFRGPVHCSEISNDGYVYVCDRAADRIQVFQKDGSFVKEVIIAPETLSQGSTWDLDFSPDPEQTYLYLADGQNMKVYIIERETMEVLTAFGDGGRQPGMFFAVHSLAVDSDGNIYTTETYQGRRVQKFVYKGLGPIPAGAEGLNSQGPVWPSQ
jgi:sugar lactone lactonase YvrE